MKTKQFTSLFFSALTLSASMFFSSCTKEDDGAPAAAERTFGNGIFVTNEGQFQKGNGDVSFIEKGTKNVEPDLFMAVNNRPVADVLQSMTFHNGKAYLIANNSAKIEVADASTFKSVGVINNLKQPRYMAVHNNKGYVTEHIAWGAPGSVSVIDLTTNSIIKTIPVGVAPEQMLVLNNKLYVANAGSNFISVINPETDAVESTIPVLVGAADLALDANNKIWALCAVSFSGNAGSLVRINPATSATELKLDFTEATTAYRSVLKMNAAKNTLFMSYANKVYKMAITETALPATFINRNFYGIGVDPQDNNFYGGDAGNNATRGKVIRYNPSGQAVDSFTVGIAPNEFYFR